MDRPVQAPDGMYIARRNAALVAGQKILRSRQIMAPDH
jgi:hypothetical protein